MAGALFSAVVDQLAALPGGSVEDDEKTLQFGGFGEPLCHEGLTGFVHAACQAGLTTELVTNGALLSAERGLDLVRAGIRRIIVSVGGPTGSGLEDGNGAGLPPAVQANLVAMRHAVERRELPWPAVTLHVVIGRSNVGVLAPLRSTATVVHADRISVSHVLPHTEEMARETLFGARLPSCHPSQETPANRWQPEIVLPPLEWGAHETAAVRHLLAGQSRVVMGRTRIDFGDGVCPFVAEGRIALDWQGHVAPCLPLLHDNTVVTLSRSRLIRHWHVGDVSQTPLASIWNAPDYRAFRERVRAFSFPPCAACGRCELAVANEEDCYGNPFPTCGDCLYARGLVRCP
jgi:MoaA/NifB/PqqE/SkfB family radical SAM enzyme